MALAGPPRSHENGSVAWLMSTLTGAIHIVTESPFNSVTQEPQVHRIVALRARTPDSLEKRLLLAARREHGRRPKGRETDVERIIERCAGLDVHKASVTACVRILD